MTEVGEFVRQRANDLYVHLATNPRLAASYARRGSEIDYFGRQAVWRLQNPTTDEHDPIWSRSAMKWAKNEAAHAELPALVRVEVPHTEVPNEKLRAIEKMNEVVGDRQGTIYRGEEVLLLPGVASKYAVRLEPVEPCTCWQHEGACPVCEDYRARPGGWNGTFL